LFSTSSGDFRKTQRQLDLTRAEDCSPPGSSLLSDPNSPNKQQRGKRKNHIMKSVLQLKNAIPPFLSGLALVWFVLLPHVQAVVPPPDGGYPNFTTAEGTKALQNLTTGAGNTAVGWFSLFSATTASFNTGVGAGTLALNTGDNNTATGTAALFLNTTGFSNTAVGSITLLHNDTGNNNTGIGAGALTSNTTGSANTAIGVGVLASNTGGGGNTATGTLALNANNGSLNTATGLAALQSNTTGGNNTAMGAGALNFNTTGHENTAVGQIALQNNVDGTFNSALGQGALASNTSGSDNTASGAGALFENSTGHENTAVGFQALNDNIGGNTNTAIGQAALSNNTTGSGNIAIGAGAGQSITTENNTIMIGSSYPFIQSGVIRIGSGNQSRTYIAAIHDVTTDIANAIPVLIAGDNQLGTMSSSRRFKKDIKPMDQASEAILALKPVRFQYKSDNTNTPQFGLVAEEVADVNSDLVVRDKNGEIYTVRYDAVNAMLLNEFLKEHKAFLEERRNVKKLEAALEAVTKRLNEQEAKIESVSAQMDIAKTTAQMVSNNP
jgi:trimeric autotransporter adhesin